MQRQITGYHKDERDDWVAELDCGHGQHVRHNPPFTNRPWTTTIEGRDSMLGETLDCVRCDRAEFPDGLTHYRSTPEFVETSIPAGLLKDHSTKRGVWGVIRIFDGELQYWINDNCTILTADEPGIVVPEQLHHIAAPGSVRFQVEFYRL